MHQLLTALLCCTALISSAQQGQISGHILDESSQPLSYTSLVLLNKSDSSVAQFTLSEGDGKFQFKNLDSKSYVVQAFYNGYEMYQYALYLKSGENHQCQDFKLIPSSTTLSEALVVAKKIPMVFKGDTIVYNPSAFSTKTNATVEDLLKKLPGVQVAKDGTVTAQGEKVVKVMVNGKEFFGNDPTKATQNLDADAIEKVEVLDRKTDESDFTGVDDGTREKVINLVLKEDANKGYFGKLEAGGGTEETYKIKGVVNYFNKENQMTVIGNINNLNQNGFSWSEYYRMLNGSNGVNLGSNTYWNNQNEWLGANEQGRQTNAVLGANAHLKAGKGEVDVSYFLMNRSNTLSSTSKSENYLPNRTIYSNSGMNSEASNGEHKMMAKYVLNPDTLNRFELQGEFDYKVGDGLSSSYSQNTSDEGSLLNNSLSQSSFNKFNLNYKGKLMYMRKFKNSKHYLVAESGIENNVGEDTSKWANSVVQHDIDYTEVLPYQYSDNINGTGAVLYNRLGFNYNIKGNYFVAVEGTSKISDDSYLQNRRYMLRDSLLADQSPDITTRYNVSKGKLRFTKNVEKEGWFLTGGLEAAHISLNRDLSLTGKDNYQKDYLFLLPSMYVSYRKPKSGRIGIWLNANENLPGITQINPVADVSNPLSISSGNFSLEPNVSYNLGTHFNIRNQAKSRFIYGNINTGFAPNTTIGLETRDTNNFSVRTTVNGKTSDWLNATFHYQFPVKKLNTEIGLSLGANHYGYYNILNEKTYHNNRNSLNLGIDLEFDFDVVVFDIAYEPDYTIQNSEVLSSSIAFWKHDISSEVQYQITDRIEFSVEYNLYYFQSQAIGQQQLVSVLNSGIEWSLDTMQKWTLSLIGYDMLKQAQVIDREFFGTSYFETRQNTITRFFMFNVAYSIKKGKKKEERHRGWDY